MNITEANDVVTLLRVLDGTAWDRHVQDAIVTGGRL